MLHEPIDVRPHREIADQIELFARYIAQIKARIERARESIDSSGAVASTACQAYITQDASGLVLEVELTTCDIGELRREALVTAILRSSPLPAPSVSQVFSERVAVEFGATR